MAKNRNSRGFQPQTQVEEPVVETQVEEQVTQEEPIEQPEDNGPEVLDEFEFRDVRLGGKAVYDWDLILDGQIRKFREGKDYQAKTSTFVFLARMKGKKRGLIVRNRKVEGGVVIQAQPDPNHKSEENGSVEE